ncbi:hypothetical protein KDAU_65600 [Dictyobacter aurantiacus]|uniref:Uncharacterized protein n=1 Tax=Dictyobacter aurantiacus TaxID=1936993 RepID=A0A401ZQT9_9CHLR|nr:hypothetical protein KDAU_65600 [Dictyobacter aurantiacus]
MYYKLHAQPRLQKLLCLLFADLLEPDGAFEANVYAELEQYWLQVLQQAQTLLVAQGHFRRDCCAR